LGLLRDVVATIDEAIRFYSGNMFANKYTPTNLMEAMGNANVKAICYICMKEFKKLLFVVDPTHGDEFQSEVSLLFIYIYIYQSC
jgi:hypothetical protein